MSESTIKIALAGNPNSGKSSVFNQITGLNQKVGNYPGVTVDKKTSKISLPGGGKAELIDLPGCYSIYPKSEEEQVVWEVLTNPDNSDKPDVVLVVADATNLKRNLLLFTQIVDLGHPTILLLNMIDVVERRNKIIEADILAKRLDVPVIPTNARDGSGIEEALKLVESGVKEPSKHFFFYNGSLHESDDKKRRQEILDRYAKIDGLLEDIIHHPKEVYSGYTRKLDRIFTHRIFGYFIFLTILLFVFQAIFKWAETPMDWIDQGFTWLAAALSSSLPSGILTDLLTGGIIPGLAGIMIFIPQIAILFAVVSLLEESGYMSRVVFLMDKIMRKVGLNGRSVVPLISGIACAVPAIMATRGIASKKDRLITILVTPFMSCSARLPVYAILIALVIPNTQWGIFNLQGLTLFGLYFLGFFAALAAAAIIKLFVKTKERSYLVMEMPSYKVPRWKNMGLLVLEKTKTFVFEAGKIIMAISIILWFAASYGPAEKMETAEEAAKEVAAMEQLSPEETENRIASVKLENSYAGHFGKFIEPAIRPLGYDWKIGIALISSFAAREVFVGTIATIYSVGNTDDELTVMNRLEKEINPDTGEARFTLAVGVSLLLFYAFAMQCMSTLAVVYRETKGWKWPAIQFTFMLVVAYLSSFIAYQLLS